MKKVLLLLTVLLLCNKYVCLAADFTVGNFGFRISDPTNLEVCVSSIGISIANQVKFELPAYVTHNNRTYKVVGVDGEAYTRWVYNTNKPCDTLYIPNTITKISANAFYNNEGSYYRVFANTIIAPSVTSIGTSAFYIRSFQKAFFPSLEEIGGNVFFGAGTIQLVWFGADLKTMDPNTFSGCHLLEMFCLAPSQPKGFYVPNTSCTIFVPLKSAYMDSNNIIGMVDITENDDLVYNGKEHSITLTNNLKKYYNCEMTVGEYSLEKTVGTHTTNIPVSFTGDYDFDITLPYTYTIKKAPLKIIVNDAKRTYGEENPEFTYRVEGLLEGDKEEQLGIELSTLATKSSDAGDYDITASITSDNYDVTVNKGTLSVTKAPLTAMVEDKTKTYGSENPTFSLLYAGLKNDDATPAFTTQPEFTTEVTKKTDVGVYTVSASGAVSKNYDITAYQPGKLTIEKAPLTITPNAAMRYYGDENPEIKYTYTGFVEGDDNSVLSTAPTCTLDVDASTSVGSYTMTPSGAEAKNYDISYNNGTFQIVKAPLTIKAENKTKVYGETNPELTVIYSGFKNREDASVLKALPIVSCSATKTSDVGKYTITVYGATAENYDITYQSGTLSVTQAPQLISWNQDFSKVTHNDVMELNASSSSLLAVTYSASNTSVANVYTQSGKTYVKFIQPGKVSITAKQTGSTNYASATPITKDIVVEPLHVNSVSLNRTSFEGNKGNSVSLTASVSPSNASNTSITWKSSNTSVATVSSTGYVNIVGLGECTITATSDDNSTIKATCSIKCVPTRHDVVLANAGYATFYDSKENYIIPAGITAQVITGLTNDGLKYSTIADGNTNKNIIPKATAVMLVNERKTGGTFTLVSTDNVASYTGINYLAGSDSYTKPSGTSTYFYKLAYSNSSLNKFGWYWGASNGAAFYIDGHKAWLALPKTYASSAKTSEFLLEDFEPTAVENVEATTEVEKQEYYDVAGRKLNNAPQKGIFILNGKTHLK